MSAPQLKTDSQYDDYDYPTTSPNVQSGHPGHTTPEQDAQVHQLRMQLEQAGYSERLDTLSMVSNVLLSATDGGIKCPLATVLAGKKVQCRYGEADVRFHRAPGIGRIAYQQSGSLTAKSGGRISASTISSGTSTTRRNPKCSNIIPSITTRRTR